MTISLDAIERRLNLGVLNLWYPVLPSWGVTDTPVGVTRLGQQLVLWRDQDGQIQALEDRCPHRGARFVHGLEFGAIAWPVGITVLKSIVKARL